MAEKAVALLRDAILSGALKPGEPLREVQLASELSVSRAPLREALQRLEEEGLIVRQPFRGSFVAEVSVERLADIERLRAVLEPYAALTAIDALRSGPANEAFEEAVKALEAAAATGDARRTVDAHLGVHRVIYEATGNQVLLDLWRSWQNQMRLFMAVDHRRIGNLIKVAAAHRGLLNVIQSGDKQAIRREFARHIRPDDVEQGFGQIEDAQDQGDGTLWGPVFSSGSE